MKKAIILTITLITLGVMPKVNAQLSVGGNAYYTTNLNGFGVGGSATYQIDKTWAISANATYYFNKSERNNYQGYVTEGDYSRHTWGETVVNFNGQFNLTEINRAGMLYGFGGLGIRMLRWNYPRSTGKTTSTMIGFNLGVGLRAKLNEKMFLEPNMFVSLHEEVTLFKIGAKLMFGM